MSVGKRPPTPSDRLIEAWIKRHLRRACLVFRTYYAQLDYQETAYQALEPIQSGFRTYSEANQANWQAILSMDIEEAIEHRGLWKWIMNRVAWRAKDMRRKTQSITAKLEKNGVELVDISPLYEDGGIEDQAEDEASTPELERLQEKDAALDHAFRVVKAADRAGMKRQQIRAALVKGLYKWTIQKTADELGMTTNQVKYALKRFREVLESEIDSHPDNI